MLKRKLNTVSSKAQMTFTIKEMAPLGLFAKSLGQTSREYLSQSNPTVASGFCQKDTIWEVTNENTSESN